MDKATRQLKDVDDWGRLPFMFQLGKSFETYREVVEYMLAPEHNTLKTTDASNFVAECTPKHFTRVNQADTSVGGNDAINPLWQFGVDDDIIHPLTALQGDMRGERGMGRVYSEMYDMRQQICWMTMGVPEFTDMATFYKESISGDLANLMNRGDTSLMSSLGSLLGTTLKLAFTLPFLPFIFINRIANAIDTHKVTKYYDFKSTMPLYFRFVNSFLAHLAINMGLYPNGQGGMNNGQFNETYKQLWSNNGEAADDAIPEILRHGLDIYTIISKRDRRVGLSKYKSVDEFVADAEAQQKGTEGWFDAFLPRLVETMTGGDKFIGFRVEKSTDSSESLSNSTGESSLAQTLNSTAAGGRETAFNLATLTAGNDFISGLTRGITDFMKGAVSSIIGDFGTTLATGSGFLDIPEVWKSSNFSKSYSFSMDLRAPCGDPVSIFQSIYVPLAMILAAALPRAIGRNAYTSPFLVRAYCKGMFAIPLGIIESISITRGASEHGWTYNQLPTCVHVSFSIKDLSPIMHMAVASGMASAGGSILGDAFGQNSSFQEYMLTLSGMGLNERILFINNVARKLKTSLQIFRSTYTNPLFWATAIGNSSVARIIGAISPRASYGNR